MEMQQRRCIVEVEVEAKVENEVDDEVENKVGTEDVTHT